VHPKHIAAILEKYDLKLKRVLRQEKGYRNHSHIVETTTGEILNVVLYKRERSIAKTISRANAVSDYLSAKGFPSRTTTTSSTGRGILRLRHTDDERYVCIYNYLPGKTISWDAYTKKHIKLLGKTMSDMHSLLRDFNPNSRKLDLPNPALVLKSQLQSFKKYLANKPVSSALQQKLSLKVELHELDHRIAILEDDAFSDSYYQVLHMDLVRSNILFSPQDRPNLWPSVSGVIDFEKVAYGPKIFDVARTLSFLYIDCKYKQAAKVRKYFLLSGYQKRGLDELPALELLDQLIEAYWLYDFYKFLKHNPYEYLSKNEHFVRTREALKGQRLIFTVG
jgi:Ser/Thr protein kinase RdoA (MazF antagonist)